MNETKVFDYVKERVDAGLLERIAAGEGLSGVTAGDVEREFNMYRSNASALLNQLVKKGLLVKVDSRPVYFLPADTLRVFLGEEPRESYTPEEFLSAFHPAEPAREEDPFDILIGSRGSLAHQIDQAKAAILYPPKGLHTLLIGESGAGKTLFARAMYDFGHARLGGDRRKYPFVEFNCSDYYHNPQLLMSHLFGHLKGAFTGAEQEREGLVEKADGGILFLDEIHRLPPEGQELLFYLMDTGCYRKLGESSNMRRAQVLIIGATTEDPRDVLLKTFMRRIPLTIKLPPYRERSTEERLQIIEHIFMRESTATQKTYIVGPKIVKALIAYDFPENIGQLSSEIKVLCARSFLNNVSGQDELVVSFDNLSPAIREKYRDLAGRVQEHFPSRYEQDILVAPSSRVRYNYSRLFDEKAYQGLMKSIDRYTAQGLSKQELDEALSEEIRAYCNNILKTFYSENIHKEELYKVVDEAVVDFTVEAAAEGFAALGLEMSQRNVLVLAFHFKYLLERLKTRSEIDQREIAILEREYVQELAAAERVVERLEERFEASIPKEEKYFIAILLANMRAAPAQTGPALLIVAHGASTASSMANVCNRLMDCDFVRAVDAPLEQSVAETYENVLREVRRADAEKGVLLLVDMGSLVSFGERLTAETGVSVKAIPNVTTLLALDMARTMLSTDKDVGTVFAEYQKKYESPRPVFRKGSAILSVCASGAGTSVALQSVLEEELRQRGLGDVKVLTLAYSDVKESSAQYQAIRARYELLACVGNVELQVGAPFFHVSQLIGPADKAHFFQVVGQAASLRGEEGQEERKESLQDECRRFLGQNVTFVNPDVAVRYAERFLTALDEGKVNADRALRMSLILHLGFMVERNICRKHILFDGEAELIARHGELHRRLRECAHILEEPFEIEVSDAELCYIIQTITQYGEKGTGHTPDPDKT
jgi:transcriptional regulator with AAA-type ATPase domain/transcriptional regulatory protein LevR